MKITLLEIVQNIMSAFSFEEVNSIEDRPEALQIVEIVRETYYEILSHRDWDFAKETFTLSGLSDVSLPTVMRIPDGVGVIDFIKYYSSAKDKYERCTQYTPEAFLEKIDERKTTDSNIVSCNFNNLRMKIRKDKDPDFFTSFDQKYVIFDSYNSTIDSTLQENKTLSYGTKAMPFEATDDFVIDFPEDMIWSYLLPEVKSVASFNLLQRANEKEEQRSRRGRWRSYYANPATKNESKVYPNYGRK